MHCVLLGEALRLLSAGPSVRDSLHCSARSFDTDFGPQTNSARHMSNIFSTFA